MFWYQTLAIILFVAVLVIDFGISMIKQEYGKAMLKGAMVILFMKIVSWT